VKVFRFIIVFALLAIFFIPSEKTIAQTSSTVENFFGEGSFMDGYDFSDYAVQRWGESGPDNPGLSPDFYFGDSNMPVTTPNSFSPKATIDYATTPLSSITEIPSQSDSRFIDNYFVQGRTYGMFTLEGDYVVIQVTSLYEQPYDDWHKNGMTFNWMYVEGGLTGELTLSLYPLDKTEFAMGDSPTIGGDVLVGGQPLANAEVCTEVWGDALEYMYGVCHYTDSNGQFSFWLEYGVSIPTGYRGNLLVEGNVTNNGAVAYQNIYVPYGNEALDLTLDLALSGPDHPIEIGGWEDIGIGGTVTSQGMNVDGALVTMKVAGQTFQTTTGTHTSGQFNSYWANNSFPAGNYWVEVTITKDGYQGVTDSVPFSLLGEGYNYLVTMDPIPPNLNPGSNVPFPGTLTLGGTPVADWINIYVTNPNGLTNGYSNLTDADGRFTHPQPSLNEIGTYQLVVHFQADDKQISEVYTFTVGATPTPTVTPSAQQPTPAPRICEIIDVVYPSMVLVGENVDVSGKVVCRQGKEEIMPQEGWNVSAFGTAPYQSPVKAPIVQTGGDGSFAATFTPNVFYILELGIFAQDSEIKTRSAGWHGPLSVVVGIEPDITLSQTDYDQGEIVEGDLKLNPNNPARDWDSGLEIYYQIKGPVDGASKQYLFESQYLYAEGVDHFYWEVPHDAGAGKYTLTAYISGRNIATQTAEVDYYVNDIQHTNLSAVVEPALDGWTSSTLVGQYTDSLGIPITKADVRVVFLNPQFDDKGEIFEFREFKLTGKTDEIGNFEINLEPLDIFAGKGQADPWLDRLWFTTVYADKEGYATGAAIIEVKTPTVKPRIEIISVDPPLDYLSKLAERGLSYEQLTKMNIQVRVRYNNILGDGAKLNISAGGNWAVTCDDPNSTHKTLKAHLAINGEEKPEWESYMMTPSAYQEMRAWHFPGSPINHWFYYPTYIVSMPASKGVAQESTISVSGELFGYSYGEDSPNQCGGGAYSPEPVVPPQWVVRYPAVSIGVRLGSSSVAIIYNITPPSISVDGTAWVSPTDGEFKGNVYVGKETSFPFRKQQVNLAIIEKNNDTGVEKPTSEITIQPSARTDDKGDLNLPLTAKTNPCDLEEDVRYYVKITSPDLAGEGKIPIELRCVKALKFELNPAEVFVIQVVDLSDGDPIQLAARKEAGVRVYLEVDGEIFQPENRPVEFTVKFEMFREDDNTPLFPQTKIFSLSEKGASVAWVGTPPVNNNGVTGEIAAWENKGNNVSGKKVIPLDFAFKPYELSGDKPSYRIRITVDPNKVYGESVLIEKAPIFVKKMKRLQILFVPVQRPYTDFNIDKKLLLKQLNLLNETYPIAQGVIGWGIAKNFIWDDDFDINVGDQWATNLGRLALSLGRKNASTIDPNVEYRIVGVVQEEAWLNDTYFPGWFNSTEAFGVYFGNGVTLVRQGDTPSNNLAHEIGHSFGLYTSSIVGKISKMNPFFTGEQYEEKPDKGKPVHGLIMRNSRIYNVPVNHNDTSNLGWIEAFGCILLGAQRDSARLGNAYISGINPFDIMGRESRDYWVIPSTYGDIFDKLKDPPGELILSIQGGVLDDNTVELLPVWQVEGHPDVMSEEGEFSLELRSSNDEVLYQTRFSIQAGWPGYSEIFALRVPFKPGTARVVILDDSGVVGEVTRSANSPEIQISSQPIVNDENVILSLNWTASDLDGDEMIYSSHYQCDGSPSWIPLSADLSEPTFTFETSGLPGGERCVVRVMVTDGFNSAETISDPFPVLSKVPFAEILTEANTFSADERVTLLGAALDLEDGIVPSENLTWFSDIDGELGVGSAISVMLSPGTHNITLYAQDAAGNTTIAEKTFTSQTGSPFSLNNFSLLSAVGGGVVLILVLGGVFLILLLVAVFANSYLRKRRRPKP